MMTPSFKLYARGYSMNITISEPELLNEWNQVADNQLEDEEREKLRRIAKLMQENRKLAIQVGEGNSFFGRITEECG
jgi:Rad3-related DNA helicase